MEYDTAIFEPVVGNAGSHTLCPGIVKLESERKNKKSRFVVQYINVTNEKIDLEPRRTLGFVQPCKNEKLPVDQCDNVNIITEKSKEEQQNCLFQTVDAMFPIDSNENKILKGLIMKYPSVFANDDDPPSVTPFYYHTIKLESTPKPRKPYPIPVCYHEKVKEQIKIMEKHGIIRPSRSSFQSPLVPVIKKDGKLRLCIDFRNLNTHVMNDSYPYLT